VSVRVMVCPVPVSGTDCGLPDALSVNVKDADLAPLLVGENVTLTVQAAPPASVDGLLGQLLKLIANWLASVPVREKPVKVTGMLPVFVTIVPCAALVLPVF